MEISSNLCFGGDWRHERIFCTLKKVLKKTELGKIINLKYENAEKYHSINHRLRTCILLGFCAYICIKNCL